MNNFLVYRSGQTIPKHSKKSQFLSTMMIIKEIKVWKKKSIDLPVSLGNLWFLEKQRPQMFSKHLSLLNMLVSICWSLSATRELFVQQFSVDIGVFFQWANFSNGSKKRRRMKGFYSLNRKSIDRSEKELTDRETERVRERVEDVRRFSRRLSRRSCCRCRLFRLVEVLIYSSCITS